MSAAALFFVGVGALAWLAIYLWVWWEDRRSTPPWERKQNTASSVSERKS